MADCVVLLRDGHTGQIVAVSRRGLMPKAHRRVPPLPIDELQVPFGASASQLLRWLRHLVDNHSAQGGNWRSVVDGLRPHTQRLWRELPIDSRRRFLEHARAWWDVHRHRMAPEVEFTISQAVTDRRLTLMAAKIIDISPNPTGATVCYRRRGQAVIEDLEVTHRRLHRHRQGSGRNRRSGRAQPADQGLARIDPLHMGIDVAPDCEIVNRRGLPSRRLFAIGPLTRAAFWEIIAIPDIRNQSSGSPSNWSGTTEARKPQPPLPSRRYRPLPRSGERRSSVTTEAQLICGDISLASNVWALSAGREGRDDHAMS